MAKSERVMELEESIVQATALLDEADGSRVGMSEAFDSAREILSDTYGLKFEDDVSDYISNNSEDDESENDDDED
jgi:hypothetical protein